MPELGMNLKNMLLCVQHQTLVTVPTPRVQQKLPLWEEGVMGMVPSPHEGTHCLRMFTFYYHHLPTVLNGVKHKILNNVTDKMFPPSCSLPSATALFGGWNLPDNMLNSNPV